MRIQANNYINSIWNSGIYLGDNGAPCGRITVQPDWQLQTSSGPFSNYLNSKLPVRYFQRSANDQIEYEMPNVIKTIDINRQQGQDAGTLTVVINNTIMEINGLGKPYMPVNGQRARGLGDPGHFTFDRGENPEANARWGYIVTPWTEVLVPNAMLRVYQGYGGRTKPLLQALADGNIVQTGCFLIDRVIIKSNGTLEIQARDMGKLLIEQYLYPPLVPQSFYPIFYQTGAQAAAAAAALPPVSTGGGQFNGRYGNFGVSAASSSDVYAGFNGSMNGHRPTDAFDGNNNTYWESPGNSTAAAPFATEWIEVLVGQDVSQVSVTPVQGGMQMFISVMVNGAWLDHGLGTVPYNAAGVGRYTGNNTANIPFIFQAGLPAAGIAIAWGETDHADKIRLSFTNLQYDPNGPYHYRATIREIKLGVTPTITRQPSSGGDYEDYADIVKDILLWCGWWFQQDSIPGGPPQVWGNIETTGVFDALGNLSQAMFDKVKAIDAINTISQLVGYIFYIDEYGGAHWSSPNWWMPGNFLPSGIHTTQIPEIDENRTLIDYSMDFSDDDIRSSIIVTNIDPALAGLSQTQGAVTEVFVPADARYMRGIQRPFLYPVPVGVTSWDAQILARLIGLFTHMRRRVGSVTCPGNPLIGVDDQVRIWERVTNETYTHYVLGVHSTMDLDSGAYTMQLTTNWLGWWPGHWIIMCPNHPAYSAGDPLNNPGTLPNWMIPFRVDSTLMDLLVKQQSRALLGVQK